MSSLTIRSIQLLRLIPPWPRRVDVQHLHDRLAAMGLPTTRRQLRRLLQDLSAHYPLDCDDRDKPYGWCWAQGSAPPVVGVMDVPTAVVLTLAAEQMGALLPEAYRGALAPLFEAARGTLASVEQPLDRSIAAAPRGLRLQEPVAEPAVLEAITDGVARGVQVRLTVRARGGDGSRSVRATVLGLVARAERTYAVLRVNQEVEAVPLHRVAEARATELAAEVWGFDLRRWIADGGLDRRVGDEPIQLQVLLTSRAAAAFVETPLADDQRVEVVGERVRVSATVFDSHALRSFLLGFGSECEVVGPEGLRGWFGGEISSLSAAYLR
jgi:predicted DNA-binding transcriptional regulator YafY